MGSLIQTKQTAEPSTPSADKVRTYPNAQGQYVQKDWNGVVTPMTAMGSWVDVKRDFGAVGDGVADDTTAIQNAINSFNSSPTNSGGVVWFPSGIYKITGTLTVTTYHVQLVGASKTDCVLKTNHVSADILQFNSWYCSVTNMTFDSSVVRTGGYALKMTDGNNRHLAQFCEFNNMKSGIQMNAHLSAIYDCEFRTFVNGGSWIEISCNSSAAHDMKIERCTADNGVANKNAAATAGVLITQVASLLMEGCSWVNAGALGAMYINPGAAQVVPTIYCLNTFFDQSGYGLRIDGNATGTIQRLKFTNCWFSSHTNDGVFFNCANAIGIQGVNFVNCDFYQNVHGINAAAGYQDWSVGSSRFSGNTTTGIRTTAIATASFKICDCFIGTGSGFGANALGINVQAGTYASYQIVDNRGLASNTTGGITDSGSVTGFSQKNVTNNVGDLLYGRIASTVANSAAINTVETIVVGGTNNAPIPANALKPGVIIKVTLEGTNTSTVAGISTFRVRFGTAGTTADTAILTAALPASAAAGTNIPFQIVIYITIRTIGAAGTVVGILDARNDSGATVATASTGIMVVPTELIVGTPAAINTTVASYISVTCQTAAATTTNTFQQGIIEIK